jgi:hypothetical protein
MLIPAQTASNRTRRAINKNERYPRTELDDIADKIEMKIRQGSYYLEVDGELERDTVAALKAHGYLVDVVKVETEVAYIATWSK